MDEKRYTDVYRKNQMNSRRRNLTARDYDGVVFEPSRASRARRSTASPENAPRPRAAERPVAPVRRKRKSRSQQSQFTAFYIVTLFTGVIICIVIFAVMFNTFSQRLGNAKLPSAARPSATPPPTSLPIIDEISRMTALVREVDTTRRLISVMDIADNANHTLALNTETVLKDKYGQTMALANYTPGSIVDAAYEAETGMLTSLTASSLAWEYRSQKDIRIDAEGSTISRGNSTYSYDGGIIVSHNGQPYDIERITDEDVLTIAGFEDRVWYLQVDQGHGTMEVINFDHIKNGTLEVDTSVYKALDEELEPIVLTEGSHRIVVKGSNIDPYITELEVGISEHALLDLAAVEFKSGMLNVSVNEEGYELFIDGEPVTGREALELMYGEYTVRVQKPDFVAYEEVLVLDAPERVLEVDLKKEVKKGIITVSTDPVLGANVYIDNVLIGTSPASTEVEYGPHTITVRKDGYVAFDPRAVELLIPELKVIWSLMRSDSVMPTTVPVPPMPTNNAGY